MININSIHPVDSNSLPPEDDSELVIGLVGAVGTNLELIKNHIKDILRSFNYEYEEIRISSDIISKLRSIPETKNNYDKTNHLMTEGNKLRELSENNAILSLAVAAKISSSRLRIENNPTPSPRKAYIIHSLKHPGEVNALRQIYTNGFYLIGVYADEKRRLDYLVNNKQMIEEDASKLIFRDSEEDDKWGQHTRDTYELSDFFLNFDANIDKVHNDLWRVFDLIFGNPYVTPTFDEYAMFMAFSASLRSADLSRQVGAVLTKEKNIISTGANDVPQFGGGLYWPEYDGTSIKDADNGRDFKVGQDSNVNEKSLIIQDILKDVPDEMKDEFRKHLVNSKIKYITEYGRVVHAEMEAILACARSNINTQDGILYCTTFPCHNCAKHIIASGIKKVFYIEPYPKSKAFDFHPDSIATPQSEIINNRVIFEPFVGVGPRCFFNLFSINLGIGYKVIRKDKEGKVIAWKRTDGKIRMQMLPSSYIDREIRSADILNNLIERIKNA